MRWAALGVAVMTTVVIVASGCRGSNEAGEPTGHPLCVNGKSADGAYPTTDYAIALQATLPDIVLDATDAAEQPAHTALHDYFEPCAERSRLLVIRVSAAWCGTCRWHAAHTKELLDLDVGPRLALLDVLVADADNMPAATSDLAAWRARVDAPQKLAVDPAYRLGALHAAPAPLPLIVLVDTKTMHAVSALANPDPDALVQAVREQLAQLDGVAVSPAPAPPILMDGRFTRDQWDLVKQMTMPAAPPADPSNARADDAAAAALGKKLFSDVALSPTGTVSCASCHDAKKELGDGVPQSTGGVARVDRNAPPIALASHARWQFWDGRADSLWAQALGPPENAKELNSSRLFVDHVIDAKYRTAYEAIWGPLPSLADTTRFPANAKPGSPDWATMTQADRDAATQIFVNVGKSIAAFERALRVEASAFDRYVAGDFSALSTAAKDGLRTFFVAGCAQCHYGPRLTDDAFHAARFPSGSISGTADRGRIDGISLLRGSEFGSRDAWSDAPGARVRTTLLPVQSMLGAFKTPTLRGLPGSAPYGHAGSFATLDEVVRDHGGVDAMSSLAVGTSEPWLPVRDDASRNALVELLGALTAVPVIP